MADDIDTLTPEFNLDDLSEDGELPSTENLMKMLEESNMTDEMKENLRQMLSGGRAPELFGASTSGSWLGVVFIIVIFSIL
ncbi:unnamed protein product [Plutella xylostella]|uniref:(diamondback moth) hypothetical protein n=1 Tax=Plutella xylostella TaxID=51655 RepID=A0A8S4G6H0_PLUXY|nr:unnamed protein product [Plutella xylostella]